MGNKPSHRTFEGEPSGVSDPDSDGTALSRLLGIVRGLVGGLYRWSVVHPGGSGGSNTPEGQVPERHDDGHVQTPVASPFPQRDCPFTRPARNRGSANPSDLRATEENGRLSIYYPDRDGAEITSDTWEQVQR